MKIGTITVIGAGLMGAGIQEYVAAGKLGRKTGEGVLLLPVIRKCGITEKNIVIYA